MGWKDKMKEWGPASLLFLSTDGASVNFIVVGDPIKLEGKYRGKENVRVACPVVTSEGFVIFVANKRTARKLASVEDKFKDSVINLTRHGVEGDTDATYEVTVLSDAAAFKTLKAIAAKTYNPEALAEALKDAEEVVQR
jgi:hypothetical protein